MKNWLGFLIWLVIATEAKHIVVSPKKQLQTNWCWATCMQMTLDHLGTDIEQKSILKLGQENGQRGFCFGKEKFCSSF